jgi:transposase-like protein
MKHYSKERKQAIIEKMMPPQNCSISKIKKETGISDATLYNWRKQAKVKGLVVPGDGKNPEDWSSEDKFMVVLETATLNEAELANYCREKGLYTDQIARWKASCVQANAATEVQEKAGQEQRRQDKADIKELKRDLRRKEKALAETAALLVLRKKANAIWGESEDD